MVRVDGHYIDEDGLGHAHSWNFDPETRRYVDLTEKQFDDLVPEILVLDANSVEARKRYLEH